MHLGLALACMYGIAAIVGFVCLALGQFELRGGFKALKGALSRLMVVSGNYPSV